MSEKIRLGISSCLLGENVRYNGGHKLDRFLRDTLGQYVEFVPVCPEVECGLPVPREAMRLLGDPESPRLVTSNTGKDLTEQMLTWARRRVKELDKEDLCGFIFKSGSPSSGMERVKVYGKGGMPQKKGVGMFARAFIQHSPLLPVEEEGRLHDVRLRENFIERIFTLKRWRALLAEGRTRGGLVRFHARHKYLILSHSKKHAQELGRIVASIKKVHLDEIYDRYYTTLIDGLRLKTTVKKNTNVLQHMMGFFKKVLTADEKQELLESIGYYHKAYVPLLVPLTLINHYVRKYDEPYLRDQYYLNPHPLELQLRAHV